MYVQAPEPADIPADALADPAAHYRALAAGHESTLAGLRTRSTRVLQGILLAAAFIAYITFRTAHNAGSNWTLLAGFVAIAALIPAALRVQRKVTRQQRLLSFYASSLDRVEGKSSDTPRTGLNPDSDSEDTLRTPGHLYEHDLDLLGPHSLFAMLATVRTGLGEHGLARFLLEPATHDETLARQAAVRELAPQTALREQIALLGATKFQQTSSRTFNDWLADPPPVFAPAFRPVLAISATLAIALLLMGLLHLRTWGWLLPNLVAVFAIQGGGCAYLRARVLPLLQGGTRLQGNIKLLTEGLALLQQTTFASPLLQSLQAKSREPAGAVTLLKQLDNQLAIVEQRPKEYFFVLSVLLAAGTQAAISIAGWKRQHAASMQVWIAAWAEFEALNALANFAFEHPAYTWPELLPPTNAPLYAAESLGHPLLAGAIRNDISLGAETRFYLISGSNMSGKSTLLRSIGINAVLAYAGAPVCARSLRLTPLALGASLALTDSLAEGKSKFKAEVERLAGIVALARQRPVLFLVDEIFSGTNSADRRTAAAAVLRALLGNGGIGALSTHDLALTELATTANAGENRHMASPDPDDPLAFDYTLKPGINTSSNALAIVRMMGLEA